MAVLVENFRSGFTTSAISDVETTIQSADFADLREVSSPDTMKIVLDPKSNGGPPEIVTITDHVAASTTVTVTRSGGRAHSSDTRWVHSALAEDYQRIGFEGAATFTDLTVDTNTLHVDSANSRVGINTTAPGVALQVNHTGTYGVSVESTGSFSYLALSDLASTAYNYVGIGSEGDDLRISAGGNIRMSILSTGNVGIGTTTPGTTLEVVGDVTIQGETPKLTIKDNNNTGTSNAILEFTDQTDAILARLFMGAGNDLFIDVGTADFIMTDTGRLGVGTTSPDEELEVFGAGNTFAKIYTSSSTSQAGITLHVDTDTTANDYWTMYQSNGTGHDLRFTSGPTGDLVTFDTAGRVGIGTTAPLAGLDMSDGSIAFGADSSGNALNGPFGLEVYSNDTLGSAAALEATLYYRTSPNVWVFEDGAGADILSMDTDDLSATFGGRITSLQTYNNTATASTVVIDSAGLMSRSASSLKYKTDVETMYDEHADALLDLRPVWFRSLNERDPAGWSYWGFIAEEVAEIDPRLVHFGVPDDYEWQYDEKGNRIYPDVVDLTEPEDVRYSHMVPHLVNLAKRQKAAIEALEQRIATLETN